MKTKQEALKQYCFDVATKIYNELSGVPISIREHEINNISSILYREFEALDKFGMINSKYWKTIDELKLKIK